MRLVVAEGDILEEILDATYSIWNEGLTRDNYARWNAAHAGSSQRIARVLLLPDSPSIDGNEITDKGYINQRLALARRKAEVERLFATTPDADVLIVTAAAAKETKP